MDCRKLIENKNGMTLWLYENRKNCWLLFRFFYGLPNFLFHWKQFDCFNSCIPWINTLKKKTFFKIFVTISTKPIQKVRSNKKNRFYFEKTFFFLPLCTLVVLYRLPFAMAFNFSFYYSYTKSINITLHCNSPYKSAQSHHHGFFLFYPVCRCCYLLLPYTLCLNSAT